MDRERGHTRAFPDGIHGEDCHCRVPVSDSPGCGAVESAVRMGATPPPCALVAVRMERGLAASDGPAAAVQPPLDAGASSPGTEQFPRDPSQHEHHDGSPKRCASSPPKSLLQAAGWWTRHGEQEGEILAKSVGTEILQWRWSGRGPHDATANDVQRLGAARVRVFAKNRTGLRCFRGAPWLFA